MTFAPINGWENFDESAGLTAALWQGLPDEDWQYMGLTSGCSVWESRQDGNTLSVFHKGERIVEFQAQAGAAGVRAGLLATEFGLILASSDR
jgi:hypothetical protein